MGCKNCGFKENILDHHDYKEMEKGSWICLGMKCPDCDNVKVIKKDHDYEKMKKQFQDSWHGIEFNKFIEVSANKVAGKEFYDCFYEEFFKKYKSFLEIPDSYIEKKLVVVGYLEHKLQSKDSVLSIGCGIGLIEKLLIDEQKVQTKIISVEPSRAAIKWISKNPNVEVFNGFFPDVFTG